MLTYNTCATLSVDSLTRVRSRAIHWRKQFGSKLTNSIYFDFFCFPTHESFRNWLNILRTYLPYFLLDRTCLQSPLSVTWSDDLVAFSMISMKKWKLLTQITLLLFPLELWLQRGFLLKKNAIRVPMCTLCWRNSALGRILQYITEHKNKS